MNIVILNDEELRYLKKEALMNVIACESMSKKEEFKNCEWVADGLKLRKSVLNKLEQARKEEETCKKKD